MRLGLSVTVADARASHLLYWAVFIVLILVSGLVACASHLLLFATSFFLFFRKVISLPILFRVSFIGLDACAPHFA